MSPNRSENNKRIAKNTLLLYFRMLLIMAVTLYTSRVVLGVLGVEDFGIYNVIGGVVTLFSFLNNSMALSVQRYLSYELGCNNKKRLNDIYCMSVNIHFIISLLIFILAETVGLYVFNEYINVPIERREASFWLYQWSVLACCTTFNQIPYNALIIANEKMGAFAYISIVETVLKLLVAYILIIINVDKLELYGFLIFAVSLVITLTYIIYCRRKFTDFHFRFYWDSRMFRNLLGFASWTAFGEVAWTAVNQGVNIVLNMFFNPVINAARGISFQVNAALNKFVQNFQTALNPQIIKTYAAHEFETTLQLTFRGIRISFYLLYCLSLPLLLNMDYVLALWLKNVPEYTSLFCKLAILNAMIDILSNLFATVAKAYGRIRNYQMIVSFCLMLNLPISYMLLKAGGSPQTIFYVYGFFSLVLLFIRLHLMRKMIRISIMRYLKEVFLPILLVSLTSFICPYLLSLILDTCFLSLLLLCLVSVVSVALSTYAFGFQASERLFIRNKIHMLKNRYL